MNFRESIVISLLAQGCVIAASGNEIPSVFEMAQPRSLPPGAPKYSDVCMRNLRVYPTDPHDRKDTIRTIKEFQVTRMDWTYGLSREFLEQAHAMGVSVQGTVGSLLKRDKPGELNSPASIGIENLDGGEVMAHWMRSEYWHERLWGCVNKPAYRSARLEVQKRLLDLGVDRLHVDDPAMNKMAVMWGACFCEHCMQGFREYLKPNTTQPQQESMGIKDIGRFDYKEHLKRAGAPVGDAFNGWEGGELKRLFQAYQAECTLEFHRWNREQLNQYAGHTVAYSCNNGVHGFSGEYGVFDYALGELWYRDARPQHIYAAAMEAAALGKMQVITMPKPYYHESNPEWERLTRQSTAMAYACGANILVPYDIYLPIPSLIRYYGSPEQYADLFGFVRGMAEYLDGYENAYAGGRTIADARWTEKPGPVPISADRREMAAVVRVKPGRKDKVVIHLVDWGKEPQAFRLNIDPESFYGGDRKVHWRLLVPAAYIRSAHERAQASGDYSPLVAEAASGQGMINELSLPALHPWGVLVLAPMEKVAGYLWPPTILGESRFIENGQVVIRCATKGAQIRFTTDGTEPNRESSLYTEPLVLAESTVIKARSFRDHAASKVTEGQFVREESRVNILRNGDFEKGMTGWEIVNSNSGKTAMPGEVTEREDSKGRALRIAPGNSGERTSHFRLTQPFTARAGGYYDLRWRARAEQPTTIVVKLQEPTEPHRALRGISCNLDREWQEFSLRGYNADRKWEGPWPQAIRCRVQFDLKVSMENVVWLDEVQLEEDWLE